MNSQGRLISSILTLILGVIRAAAVSAADSTTLTGDWGGLRPALAGQGVDLSGNYTSEIADNPRGGSSQRQSYVDQWTFAAAFDLHKLLALDAIFQITITDRNGQDLDDNADLHTTQLTQEVFGRGQTWRLTEFWYQQSWFDDRLTWKLGRMPVGDSFGTFSCNFQNLSFCGAQAGNVRGDYWYNWPVSQWATRFKFVATDELQIKLGAYQINPTYIDKTWSEGNALFPDNPAGTTGALILLEGEWTPNFLSLPDHYKIGIWDDTSTANDVYYDVNHEPLVLTGAAPLKHHAQGGAYLEFEQQITGTPSSRGATVFLNVVQSDRATATELDRQVSLGVQYKGVIPSRPADTLGLAIAANHVSGRVAANERLLDSLAGNALPVQGSEYVTEIFYGWKPRPYVTFRPNIQYVLHPNGTTAYDNIVVIGLKTTVDF